MSEHTYKIGEIVNYSIGSDVYPAIVSAVSPSGKTVTVCELLVRGKRSEDGRLSLADAELREVDTSEPKTFRKNKWGAYRHLGCYFLRPGFSSFVDRGF